MRERAREQAELDHLERELEHEARRVRVLGFDLVKPEQTPASGDGLPQKSVARRELEDRRPTKCDGERVVVLRTRDSVVTPERRRRGSNDPPE
ncbi:MAG: hypothetical protein H6722_18695 [Sandaracinus sp.]|nr:hypothetical protein [Myxococcales bacterium]MCB9614472.1 hypothetical protein [Sandaracinus sp.]